MKSTRILAMLILTLIMGCSHQKMHRTPSSDTISPTCGLTGTVDERITDCAAHNATETQSFVLVTKTLDGKEVYRDLKTQLLWGDRLHRPMQNSTVRKACNEGLSEVGKISELTWRLPTIEEFEEAYKNGMKDILPNMNDSFWSSTVQYGNHDFARVFNAKKGKKFFGKRTGYFSIRCVAE